MIIERDIYSKIRPVINSSEAIILTGMRRVGKTTLLKFIMDKIDSDNKIFLDLENPATQKILENENYDKILESFKLLGLNIERQGYVFLDEIQFVKNSPSVVKYLMDNFKIKFFLSGSASFYLKNLFAESLAGRKYIFEIFPLSFSEFLQIKNAKINPKFLEGKISKASFEILDKYYDEYIYYGGFPGVVMKKTDNEKKLMLEDIFSSYFQLEINQLSDFRKTNVIRDLMLLLIERIGSRLDVQKLSKELGVSRETVNNYVSFLENTYFIKLIRPFSRNRDNEIKNIPKFYLCDSGLANHFAKIDSGALFENVIFSSLRNKGELNYFQKKNGQEVDFVLNKKYAYEVKTFPYEQDMKRLSAISNNLGLGNHAIVSRKYSEMDNVTYGFLL